MRRDQSQRRRRVGASAAHAGGDRDALLDRDLDAADDFKSPASRDRTQRSLGEILALDPVADDAVVQRRRSVSSVSVSCSETDSNSDAISCRPSGRGRAEVEAEVELARGFDAQLVHAAGPISGCSREELRLP